MTPANFFNMTFGDWLEHSEAMGASNAALERMISVQLRLMAACVIARDTMPGSTEQLVIEVYRQLYATDLAEPEHDPGKAKPGAGAAPAASVITE